MTRRNFALRALERNGGWLKLTANGALLQAERVRGDMSGEFDFYLVAFPAVVILGLSKGGFTGLSALAMPMLSLVESPIRAAAIVLPVLIVQDWVSVWAFRRDFSPRNLLILIPASMIGVAAGWLLAAHVSEDAVRLAVGVISIVFVFYMLLRDRLGPPRSRRPAFRAASCGVRSPDSRASSATRGRRRSRST